MSFKIGLNPADYWIPHEFLLPKVDCKIKQKDDTVIIYGKSPYHISSRERIGKTFTQKCFKLVDYIVENRNTYLLRQTQTTHKCSGYRINGQAKLIAVIISIFKDMDDITPKLVRVICGDNIFNKIIVRYKNAYYTILVIDLKECIVENEYLNYDFINMNESHYISSNLYWIDP